MHRTVKLLLHLNTEQRQTLAETLYQFTACFNQVVETGWQLQEKNGVKLHHATYYPLKEQFPQLVSDLHIQARMKATEALKSAFARLKQGRKTSQPRSHSCPARYNNHTLRVDWIKGEVNLSSIAGRLKLPFTTPAYAAKYLSQPHQTVMGDLILRKGRLWLHTVIKLPEPQIEPSTEVVGVDLGVNRPAVTSNNKFLGERRWKELEAKTFRLRRSLQAKGTRSAKRHLRKLAGKQLRRRRDHDHVLSKRIVEAARSRSVSAGESWGSPKSSDCCQATEAGSTIVLENLTDIRKRVKQRNKGGHQRRLHAWSFAQLAAFITYKAQEKGVSVIRIDPRKTSQTCTQCGYAHRSNRRTQSVFHCKSCGYELNADLNAARGIRLKFLASAGISGASSYSSMCESFQSLG